jgi:hypothetical protein
LQNLLEQRGIEARAEYESKFSQAVFGKKPEELAQPVGAA